MKQAYIVLVSGLVILASAVVCEGADMRPLRYRPDGGDFVIENGKEFFNRPLYGRNTAFRVDAGDLPEFSLYLPGRGGNLRLGMKSTAGSKWLFEAENIVSRYRPGCMVYEIRDKLLGSGTLRLIVFAMYSTDGLLARLEVGGAGWPVELVWAYGGVNGKRGRRDGDIGCEKEPVSRFFQLRPEQCRDNKFSIKANTFTLRSNAATIFGVMPQGSKPAPADATKWSVLSELLASANKGARFQVVVGQAELPEGQPVYLALQRIDKGDERQVLSLKPAYKLKQLASLFEAAEQYRKAVAERIVVETPDAFINAAVSALCVAADGIWDEPQGAFMHGAVAWRAKLLGWRGAYTGDALGWHKRARRHLSYWAGQQNTKPIPDAIPPADASSNLSRNEPALHSNGDMSNSHYDMNLVYIDTLFRHFLWTGDLKFARKIWPVIRRHLAWERRLFRRTFGPEKLPLYEAYAAIWASDDLQYHGGGVTHSSAYNYYHNIMAARIARLIGEDPRPYEREAELILKAMRRYLWLGENGWYAEWKDLLGLQLAHPAAALWTIYHTLDCKAATQFEAWQMTRYVDTQIAHIPVQGPDLSKEGCYTLPTSNWMPYTWSTNNVVMAEVAHTALAYWQAGRSEEAFKMFKGCVLDSMFQGLCPGNVGMTTYNDAVRGEAQRDFADAVGICSRALVEGLFGVCPDMLSGELLVRPGFPEDWEYAQLRHSDFSFTFQREGLTETYTIESKFSRPMKLRLQVAAQRDSIAHVKVNGKKSQWTALEESVGQPRIEVRSEAESRYEIVVSWRGDKPVSAVLQEVAAKDGEILAQFGSAQLRQVADPQNALSRVVYGPSSLRAAATGTLGHRTAFARVHQGQLNWWLPMTFEIRPAHEILPSERQDAEHIRLRLRNNNPRAIDSEVTVRVGTHRRKIMLRASAYGVSDEMVLPAKWGLPGSNRIVIDLGGGNCVEGVVTNWNIKAVDMVVEWESIELTGAFNDKLTQIFQNEYLRPRSPYCSLAIPKQGIGSWCNYRKTFEIDDTGLRKFARQNQGRFVLAQGVPFQIPDSNDAKNIVFTSQWDNYPSEVSVPLGGRASHLYLLVAGSTNSMQSRFDNGEFVVTYIDGSTERLALHNPTTWWPIDQDYFIDDYAFRRPEPIPPRVDLKGGTVRVPDAATFKGKGGVVAGGAATVLDIPLNSDKQLKSLTVRTLANEVVIGLMAVTVVR